MTLAMEDIAFSDWPGEPVDLSGSNPWLPAYGFQTPHTLLDRDDFLGNPDADLFLQGNLNQHYMYLETIQEETSDDLRSDSDRSDSRCSRAGWLATDSESGSVIQINTLNLDEIDDDSEREIACPAKRRRQDNNLLGVSDDESGQSLSRSSSLLQFENLEKQCQDICSSSPSILSTFSFDSLEHQRKSDLSPDSLDRFHDDINTDYYRTFTVDIPRGKRNFAIPLSDSEASDSTDSDGTVETTRYDSCKSMNNLKTSRSFDSLHINLHPLQKTVKEKMSAENLSEDSGYSDHLCNFMKNKSSSIPNMRGIVAEVTEAKTKVANKKDDASGGDFRAYDGEYGFKNFCTTFGSSYHDLSVLEKYDVSSEYRTPLIERFIRNGIAKRRMANFDTPLILQADAVNIEASECVGTSKYNAASASEPNLFQTISNITGGNATSAKHADQFDQTKQCYFESVCVLSVPDDLNLAGNLKFSKDDWNIEFSNVSSIAAKNWDIADLPVENSDSFMYSFIENATKMSEMTFGDRQDEVEDEKHKSDAMSNASNNEKSFFKREGSYLEAISNNDSSSFKREGSYLEAMSHRVDVSDDEQNPCYSDNIRSSTIVEFDKQILKTISETSIQSFHNSNNKIDMLFSSTPMSTNKRNVISTPNLTTLKGDSSLGFISDEIAHSIQNLPRKSSLVNRSTSTSGVSDSDEKTLTATKSLSGSTNSKGVHFCPVVSELNWHDDSESTEHESSYSLASTPELVEMQVQSVSANVVRPQPIIPPVGGREVREVSKSQPALSGENNLAGDNPIDYTFVPLKPKQAVSQPDEIMKCAVGRTEGARKDSDGYVIKAYTDRDGVTYKHTHLSDVYKLSPTPNSHVSTNSVAEARSTKSVPTMEVVEARRESKPTRSSKIGGFFSRIASFRFSSRKSASSKAKKKPANNENAKRDVPDAPKVASKEDYIFIPLKGPLEGSKVTNNNHSVASETSYTSAKPPLPKMPPRVVGASVKKRSDTIAQPVSPERRTIDSGDSFPRPMEPMGLIETDLDTEVTVITSGAHVKTRSLMNLGAEAPPRSLGTPPNTTRPHKSMEFLLDKQNLKVVEPPENDLQKGERVMSEHQLRVQRSLQKLTIPDWYKQSPVPREGFLLKKNNSRECRWTGTSSKTPSLSSLGSSSQSPVILSPTPQLQPFVRWSTSKLNSTASSPCASTRSSFNTRQPNGSVSPSSIRSSFSYRQPYLGWRSQERLSRPRTPAERLASSFLTQTQSQQQQESPEIQTSIKEVTSAIVHYVSGLKPEMAATDSSSDATLNYSQRSQSVSPRGSQRLCWLESSFVGTRPLDSPQTPITLSESQSSTPVPPSSLRLDLQTHNDTMKLNPSGPKPSPGSTTLEDVLDSLLGLPSSTRAPSPSLQGTASANTSPNRLNDETLISEQYRRRSEGSDPVGQNSSARRVNFHSSPVIRCRYTHCGRVVSASSAERHAFKKCHNCSYTYCSRACRRAHWEKHRKNCLFSRVGTLCRHVLAAAKEQNDTLLHISQIARRGFLSYGPGAVKCFFSCPEAAEKFLTEGLSSLGEPTYIQWSDLLPSEMGSQMYAELVKMCKSYNPDTKLVLYVTVCVISEAPATGTIKWERQLVSRCAKIRLHKDIPIPERVNENPETLILTCAPIQNDDSVLKSRELCLNNIQRRLRKRGVSLRRQYPEVYQQLNSYVEGTCNKFTPVTVYPRDASGKAFMCIIMLDAEPDCIQQVVSAGVRVCKIDVLQDWD